MTVPLQTSVFGQDAGLAFVFFIAFSLMFVLGVRFGLYAYLNGERTEIEAQSTLWNYLLLVGLTAALYGALGVVEAATAVTTADAVLTTPYRDGVLLAFLLTLALTMREINTNEALADAGRTAEDQPATRRSVEVGFGVLVTTSLFLSGIFGPTDVLTAVEGVAALVVAGYGLTYGRRQLTRSAVRGTLLDSLLRHLLPVVAFALLVLVVDLTLLVGLTVGVVRHIQVVFVIMTATTLMTATIKLRQNVAGL
ncbi:hypothetical protein SAMN05216388_100571 [Halorientalis persicus]|uniref:Uncharacterized protein n=1 Tax=Halorientalis persicus TaxID=1367881 RepID=A0A1H8JFQ9_9EURY|nr:hypothetical protein [Halorientalis persicus]SEN79644.1 hypothetical protein SAMN05216388_100571 [Halorientalis persicus]